MSEKRKALGRGLSALINDKPKTAPPPAVAAAPAAAPAPAAPPPGPLILALDRIQPNPTQPRQRFAQDSLDELVASVREKGVLQPLMVRKTGDTYQIIAGERRYRAAKAAGLKEVPVILRDIDDRETLEIALIENLQRQDLNIVEEAEGYQQLASKYALTQELIAQRVGKSRASVANALRILGLPPKVRAWLTDGSLSAGHAKVLLGLPTPARQEQFATRVVSEGLSVRALEKLVAPSAAPAKTPPAVPAADGVSTFLRDLEDKLHHKLGTRVSVSSTRLLPNGKRMPGKVEITYYSSDDLDRLLMLLGIADEF